MGLPIHDLLFRLLSLLYVTSADALFTSLIKIEKCVTIIGYVSYNHTIYVVNWIIPDMVTQYYFIFDHRHLKDNKVYK